MSDEPTPSPEHHATLEIRNRLGLHARAAVMLVQTASRFEADVTVSKDGQSVNGRSIMGIMMLAAEQGSSIDVTTSGPQAEQALEAIRELVDARFHEDE
jgi:phosphocarrier protein HPr